MAGVTGDSKPLLRIQYAIKYGRRDLNPYSCEPEPKSGVFANFTTPAYQGASLFVRNWIRTSNIKRIRFALYH